MDEINVKILNPLYPTLPFHHVINIEVIEIVYSLTSFSFPLILRIHLVFYSTFQFVLTPF